MPWAHYSPTKTTERDHQDDAAGWQRDLERSALATDMKASDAVEKSLVFFRKIFARSLGIDVEAEPWARQQFDHRIAYDLLRQSDDDFLPPRIGRGGILEGNEVGRQGGAHIDQRPEAEEPVGRAVRRHHDRMHVSVLGDPFEFGDAADVGRIGTDDPHRLRLDQLLEVMAQVDLLAGVDRHRR